MITLQEIKQWMQGNMDGVPVSIGEITEGSGRRAAIRTVKGTSAHAALGKSSSYGTLSVAIQYSKENEADAESGAWQLYYLMKQASYIGTHAIKGIQMVYEYPLWIRNTSEGAAVFEAAAFIHYQKEEGE